jgi:hypothetical protein
MNHVNPVLKRFQYTMDVLCTMAKQTGTKVVMDISDKDKFSASCAGTTAQWFYKDVSKEKTLKIIDKLARKHFIEEKFFTDNNLPVPQPKGSRGRPKHRDRLAALNNETRNEIFR